MAYMRPLNFSGGVCLVGSLIWIVWLGLISFALFIIWFTMIILLGMSREGARFSLSNIGYLKRVGKFNSNGFGPSRVRTVFWTLERLVLTSFGTFSTLFAMADGGS